jgi:hypothetical protein
MYKRKGTEEALKRKFRMTGLLVCLIAALLVPTAASAADEVWEVTWVEVALDDPATAATGTITLTFNAQAAVLNVATDTDATAKTAIEAAWTTGNTKVTVSGFTGIDATGGTFTVTIIAGDDAAAKGSGQDISVTDGVTGATVALDTNFGDSSTGIRQYAASDVNGLADGNVIAER